METAICDKSTGLFEECYGFAMFGLTGGEVMCRDSRLRASLHDPGLLFTQGRVTAESAKN